MSAENVIFMNVDWGGALLGQLLILYPSSLHWIWEGPQGMWISEAWGLLFQRSRWWFGLCRLSLVYPSPRNVCKSFLQPLVSHCLASSKVIPLLPSHYFLICKHLMVFHETKQNKTKQYPNLVFWPSRFAVIAMDVRSLSSLVLHSLWLHSYSVRTALWHSPVLSCWGPVSHPPVCTSSLGIILHVTWFVDSVCRHPIPHSFST